MKILLSFIFLLLAPIVSNAEIEKSATTCDSGLCLYWWPKLPTIKGWHQEPGQSQYFGFNALAPDGSTFKNSEAVMYAKASYKPREPKIKSLEAFINSDKEDFVKNETGVAVAEVSAIKTADGKRLRTLTYFPSNSGNWECVSYGEEGEFYLTFALSARSKTAYERALPSFKALILGAEIRLTQGAAGKLTHLVGLKV